jgi:anti-anti-sigma regulatory factor
VQVELSEEGERLVARPMGRMDAADGSDLAGAVTPRLTPAIRAVSIDLDGLEAISLGGVRAILKLARSLRGGDRGLDFLRGGATVRHALEQAGMADLFAFTPALHSNRGHHHESP